jgi:hypothetical protein
VTGDTFQPDAAFLRFHLHLAERQTQTGSMTDAGFHLEELVKKERGFSESI